MDGLIFGFFDNAILIAGAVTGYEIERFLPQRLQVGVGAVAGAGIGNLASDVVGAAFDPALFHMIGGIALGCLIPLAVIPFVAIYNNRRKKSEAA